MESDDGHSTGYRHVGHLGMADEQLKSVVAPAVRAALGAGRRVVLACPDAVNRALAAVARDGDDLRVLPRASRDARPATAVAELTALVVEQLPGDGRRLQLVTAVQSPPAGWSGTMQTEALFNHVLADHPVDHLCLYALDAEDTSDEPGPGAAEVAVATHPRLLTGDGEVENPGYREPAAVLTELQQVQVPDPLEATEPALTLVDLDDMRQLRRSLHRVLADSWLDRDAVEDFVLAVDEIVANAAEHGMPPVAVRLWDSADRVLCSITDHGACFDDPLAGYGPAHGDMAVGGMGLWLARRSVDSLVAAPSDDGDGCTVRLSVKA